MAQYQRLSRHEYPSVDPTRVGKMDVIYVYLNTATSATTTFTIPVEEDTPERVRTELEAAMERAAGGGEQIVEL